MNIAVGIGVLLLGGWVLPGPETAGDDFGIRVAPGDTTTSTTSEIPLPATRPEGPRTRGSSGPTDPNAYPRYGTTPRRGGEEQYREQTVPVAPTDPTLRSPDSPLASPTESSAGTMPGFGPRRMSQGPLARPTPRHATPWSRTSQSGQGLQQGSSAASLRSQQMADQLQADRMMPSAGVNAAQPRVSKPYANYTPPPAVSPYQNLYRNDNNSGTINNYYTFVRPFVDQRQTNLSFGGEIRGVQSNQRLQNTAVQRLGKLNQIQGTNAPEYFQNNGGFFPAFSR